MRVNERYFSEIGIFIINLTYTYQMQGNFKCCHHSHSYSHSQSQLNYLIHRFTIQCSSHVITDTWKSNTGDSQSTLNADLEGNVLEEGAIFLFIDISFL